MLMHKDLMNAVEEFISIVGIATDTQLKRFFRDRQNIEHLNYYIHNLRNLGHIQCEYLPPLGTYEIGDNGNEYMLSYRYMPKLNQQYNSELIKANHIVAQIGEIPVTSIYRTQYPSLLGLVADNNCYKIFYFKTIDDVKAHWALIREMYKEESYIDEEGNTVNSVYHIGIVSDRDTGNFLLRNGFEYYCIIGENNDVMFIDE